MAHYLEKIIITPKFGEVVDSGFACSNKFDPENTVNYIKAPCETILPSDKPQLNGFIVFGRDRLGDMFDPEAGDGPKGIGKDSCIDIVVGRASADRRVVEEVTLKQYGKKVKQVVVPNVNPNVFSDAARIYISQRSEIDKHFKIPSTRTGPIEGESAIAIKADNVRIIGRNSIKIVSAVDTFLSNGNKRTNDFGIELISAPSNDPDNIDLQPIPKGKNLVNAFFGLSEVVKQLNSVLFDFIKIQQKFNEEIQNHTHLSPFYGQPTSISPSLIPAHQYNAIQIFGRVESGLKAHLNNLRAFETRFLWGTGPEYINSGYHKLN